MTKAPVPEIKPVAMFLERGRIIAQEFISRHGHISAGYRATPEAAGFPAWARRGDIVHGFRKTTRQWFATPDAAHLWALAQVGVQPQSGPVVDEVTRGTQHLVDVA